MSGISMNKSLVICTTAMNYIYSILDKGLGVHDVLCNKEVALWLKDNGSNNLNKIYIDEIKNKVLLVNHFKNDFEQRIYDELKKNNYKSYYLAFCSGWHFNWLQKKIDLDISKCIILDDGVGNQFPLKQRHYLLYNFVSTFIFLKPKSFGRYRDFSNKYIKKIITIYNHEKHLNKDLEILNISNKLSIYCNDKLKKNKCYLDSKYGVYLCTDIAQYKNNRKKIINNLKYNIKFLEDKSQVPWILKCKKTDPLRNFYQDLGFKLLDSIYNMELIVDKNITCVCTNYDTFLANSIIFKFPFKYFIRENERTKLLWTEKKNFLINLMMKEKIKPIFIK